VATTVADLVNREASEAVKASDAYEQLVADLLAEVEVDEKRALKTLRDAGKSPRQLQADIDLQKRIAALRASIAHKEAAQNKRCDLVRQVEAKENERKAFLAENAKQLEALKTQLDAAYRAQQQIDDDERQLRRLLPPSAHRSQLMREGRVAAAEIVQLELLILRRRDPRQNRAGIERLQAQIAESKARLERTEGTLLLHDLGRLERELAELQRFDGMEPLFERLDKARDRQRVIQEQLAATQ
jgi:hypothetical protein